MLVSLDLQRKSEGVHYELIPSDEHEQAWNVRILEGDFVETVLQYGAISFNKVREGEMNFNFSIVSTPDQDLEVSNLDLQEEAGDILQSVIAQAISDGSLMTKEEE
jgi:hypothetical protein